MTTASENPGFESHSTTTRDSVRLSLLRFAQPNSAFPPVLLTHGTFSNAGICKRLAAYLAESGFDTWIFEWRAHGTSDKGPIDADYERFAEYDVEGAVRGVLERTSADSLYYIGHSAGGVLPWMHLARNPATAARFRGIVSMAAQTTHAGSSPAKRAGLRATMLVSNLLGRAPARLFRLGPNDETRAMMAQWTRWNIDGRWIGQGDFDYRRALGSLTVPALVFAGGGDRTIAPVEGCKLLFDALGSSDKTFVHCGKAEGFREDYDHGRIIASRSAQEEIWPRILAWLKTRSNGKVQQSS